MKKRGVLLLLSLLLGLQPLSAQADQRQDWPLETPFFGDHAYLDYLGSGAQLTLEHRKPFFGGSNAYSFGASTLVGQYFGQAQASARLRILLVELSATVGYRALWRNFSFEPGDDGEYCKACDRPARRTADPPVGSTTGVANYAYAQGSVALFVPFNEWMVLASTFVAQYEDSPDRTYDQIFTNIHDGGMMWITEHTFLFKHRDWGAIGPYLQVISMPRDGHHETEVAWGLNGLTRVGLIRRNDVLGASVLVRPGDGNYGQHWYYVPARIILSYSMAFTL